MKKHFLLFPLLGLMMACGGNSNDALQDKLNDALSENSTLKDPLDEPAKTMSFEDALADTTATEHHVSIEGYIQLPTLSNIGDKEQSVNLYGRKNQTNGQYIYTNMPVGNGKNQMKKLPLEYDKKDVIIHGAKNETIGLNQRVKMTGLLYTIKSSSPDSPGTVYFTVSSITPVAEKDFDYSSWKTISNFDDIAKTENNHKEFFLEGTVDVPMFVLTGWEMGLDLKKGAKQVSIKILTGEGPNQMENLKDNWTKKDIKIRNYKGELVKPGQKVKVYGVAALDGLHVERIE